jgi:hypothetical protein
MFTSSAMNRQIKAVNGNGTSFSSGGASVLASRLVGSLAPPKRITIPSGAAGNKKGARADAF